MSHRGLITDPSDFLQRHLILPPLPINKWSAWKCTRTVKTHGVLWNVVYSSSTYCQNTWSAVKRSLFQLHVKTMPTIFTSFSRLVLLYCHLWTCYHLCPMSIKSMYTGPVFNSCTTSVRKGGIAVPNSVSETSVKVPEHHHKQQLGAHPGQHMEPGLALGLVRVQAGLRRLPTLQHQEPSLQHTLKIDNYNVH